METIVIKIDSKTNKKGLIQAIKLFKGVTSVKTATEEELENISMLKACKAARKTSKVSKSDILNALK
jgi:hypothetical protein